MSYSEEFIFIFEATAAGWPEACGEPEEEDPQGLPREHSFPTEATMAEDHKQGLQSLPAAEASAFGSELAALRAGVEMSKGLRCKLRVAGAPAGGPSSVLCDSQPVVGNSALPES